MTLRRVLLVVPGLALGCTGPIELEDGSGSQTDSTDGSGSGSTSATAADSTITETATATITETATDTAPTIEPLPDCPALGQGSAAIGEACSANAECASGVCTIFTDAPLDPGASCGATAGDCSMRITGTSLDVVTRQPVAGAGVMVAAALEIANDPAGASLLALDVSDGSGRIDTSTSGPPSPPVGLMAMLSARGFELTSTPIVEPIDQGVTYGVANDQHDMWMVSTDAAQAWSAMLALDPAIPPEALPLGEAGGVVGLVRDSTGAPLAGATVVSIHRQSSAVVRYLANDGTFVSGGTGELGLFVILDPVLPEDFEAVWAGETFGRQTAVSIDGTILALVFTAP